MAFCLCFNLYYWHLARENLTPEIELCGRYLLLTFSSHFYVIFVCCSPDRRPPFHWTDTQRDGCFG